MFGSSFGSQWFFDGSTHVEAFNRLMYLAESREAIGWLTGPDGSGRTVVLNRFRHELERSGFAVTMLNLSGMDQQMALSSLADALRLSSDRASTPSRLVRLLGEEFCGRADCNVYSIVLIDDAHRAVDGATALIRMLLAMRARCGNGLTVIVASETSTAVDLTSDALIRVALTPFDSTEAADFVRTLVSQNGLRVSATDESVVRAISDCSAGSAARITRLCRLLKVVQDATPELPLTADSVHAIHRELLPQAA